MSVHLDALDAIPVESIPAVITKLATRLLTGPAAASGADELLTPEQVAQLLNVSKRYVYRNQRDLGAVKLGRRKLRVKRSAVPFLFPFC